MPNTICSWGRSFCLDTGEGQKERPQLAIYLTYFINRSTLIASTRICEGTEQIKSNYKNGSAKDLTCSI